jgi:hypothetical protein
VAKEDLPSILKGLVESYGTQTAVAKAIGVTDSRLAKVLKPGGDAGTLNVANCLRLAKLANLSPAHVLRAANKDDIADLIEELYGPAPPRKNGPAVAPESRRLLLAWEQLPREVRKEMLTIVEYIAKHGAAPGAAKEAKSA